MSASKTPAPVRLTPEEREAKQLADLEQTAREGGWSHAQDVAPWGTGQNREGEQCLRRLGATSKVRIDFSQPTFIRAQAAKRSLRDRMAVHERRLPPVVVDNVGLSLGAHGGLVPRLLLRDPRLVAAAVRTGVARIVGGETIEAFALQFIIDWPDQFGRPAAALEGRWACPEDATRPAAFAGDVTCAAWPWGLPYARHLLAQRGTADVLVYVTRDAFDAIALLANGVPAVAVGPREPSRELAADLRAALPAGATLQFAFEVVDRRMRATADAAAWTWAQLVADASPAPVLILESGKLTDAALAISERWHESERRRRGDWSGGLVGRR